MKRVITFLLVFLVLGYPSIGNTHDNFKKVWSDDLGDFFFELDTILSKRVGESKPRSKSHSIQKLNELPKGHNSFSFFIINNFFNRVKTEKWDNKKNRIVWSGTFESSRRDQYEIQCSTRLFRRNNSTFHELPFSKGSTTRSHDRFDEEWKEFSRLNPFIKDGFQHGVTIMVTQGCGLDIEEVIGEDKWRKLSKYLFKRYMDGKLTTDDKLEYETSEFEYKRKRWLNKLIKLYEDGKIKPF